MRDAADSHFKLAMSLQTQGDVKAAISEFDRAVTPQPDHIAARMGLGLLLAQRKQYKEAVFHYHVVLALDPYFQPAHERLCRALKLANEFRFYRAASRHF